MTETQSCSRCKCIKLLSFFSIRQNTGELYKTCIQCNDKRKPTSVVYKLYCKNPEIMSCYVGSTTMFDTRRTLHKSKCNNSNSEMYNAKVYTFIRNNGGMNNWDFDIIEDCGKIELVDLHKREKYWIDELNANLNDDMPYRTEQELKEMKKINDAKHYLKHHDKIREQANLYRNSNKEEISEKKKEKMTCDCGSTFRREDFARHKRTQKHQNYVNTS